MGGSPVPVDANEYQLAVAAILRRAADRMADPAYRARAASTPGACEGATDAISQLRVAMMAAGYDPYTDREV